MSDRYEDLIDLLSTNQQIIQTSISLGILDIRRENAICIHMRPKASESGKKTKITEVLQTWINFIRKKEIIPENLSLEIGECRKSKNNYEDFGMFHYAFILF